MPILLSNLFNQVLLRLNENSNTPAASLLSGTGTTTTGLNAALIDYYNEAAADLCRRCYPIQGNATYTSFPVGQGTVALQDGNLLCQSNGDVCGPVWAVIGAVYNGSQLTFCTMDRLELNFPTWLTDTNGTPVYWYKNGAGVVGLYPKPATSYTLILKGLVLPPRVDPAANPAAIVLDWMQEDISNLLAFYIAGQVALKNLEDPSLNGRATIWLDAYRSGCNSLLTRMMAEQPDFVRAYYATKE